jgi:Tol biopolymer transport system component
MRAYSMLPNGSALTPLLRPSLGLAPAAASRDGTAIAYTGSGDTIYFSRANGTNLRRLARNGSAPALSRDGRLLAYSSRCGITITATNGRGRPCLRSTVQETLDWSPNGKALVFGGAQGRDADGYPIAAVVVQPLHGKRRVLMRSGPTSGTQVHNHEPKWSPNGRWIAFINSEDDSRRSGLYVVRPNGTHRHRVASDALTFSWSPDSRTLAFPPWSRDGFVSLVGVNGKKPKQLRLGALEASAVGWSPDGRRLLLAARAGDDADQVWVIGRNGTGLRRLTGSGGNSLVGWTRLAPALPPAPLIPPTERVVDVSTVATSSPVVDLSADGARVAFAVKTTATDCAHVSVWTPETHSLRRFRLPAPCERQTGVSDVELAGSRAAWVSDDCDEVCELALKTATLANPLPLGLTLLEGQPKGNFWDYHLRGDGDLLVFNKDSQLLRIGTGRQGCGEIGICATLRRGAHAAPIDSVSGQLIAIREPAEVAIVDEHGTVVRVFPFADVSAARVDGGRLVVWRFGVIEVYDIATGALELSRPLPTGYRLVDVDGLVAVLLRADDVMLLDLRDGRSRTLATGDGPRFADLEPPGLYYSYGVGTGGRVVFVPRSELF